jgi:alkanesulfonate monooxygenase SsuD/methylene tetrahydromethanopterin reductase-like flavin-dependent oxidoreductase (luciferase family)
MEVGIGLPNTVPGTEGDRLLEFARRSEENGFASLNVLDRLVFSSLEPLVTLAAAGAVTSRIPLRSSVVLAPYRLNGALLAKEAASVHVLSGGRLQLGLGLGWREDDYDASGISFSERGRRMDEMLPEIERVWSGHEFGFAGGIGPDVSDNPPMLLLGGTADASFRRAARYGAGWILGGGTPELFVDCKRRLEAAWSEADRDGEPVAFALAYFSLGDQAQENAQAALGHYYAARGEDFAQMVVGGAAKDPDTVRGSIQAYTEAGCDELFFVACSDDPAQVDLLADAALRQPA